MSDVRVPDPWTALSPGEIDPLTAEHGPMCMEHCPPGQRFVCTRPLSHVGLHVATTSSREVCCPSWGIAPHLRLPEGF